MTPPDDLHGMVQARGGAADASARQAGCRPYSLVLFDLDEVLVDYDHHARLDLLAARSGTSREQVYAALFQSGLEHDSDMGRWQPQAYADELARRLGAPVTLADCVDARAASMRIRPRMLALAERVAQRTRIGILTNNGLYMRDTLPRICPALFPLFEGKVRYAAQFRLLKPDPQVYLRCLPTLDAPPAGTLFIDDKPENVEGAIAAGLDAVQFTDAAALAEALLERGLIDREAGA
ncbi:HAD family hydrolase [Luteimonas aquatica]|uniref:HAD family hydrolase n=1 Tax=Luteimonas aquatica TaxID=450364 RepID=UPI001F56A50D|nr:HAD family phosphatase [Luteimonas aquatica]